MFRTALISMFLTSAALADTWTVDDDGKADFNNIQAAVDAASDGDEIIVMPGIYRRSDDQVVYMNGKAVWLHSSDGPEVTIIDGENQRRGVDCVSGETNKTVIEGFTITGGYAGSGGGMYCDANSNPTIKDCLFRNNYATSTHGGGIHNNNSSPTLINCIFTENAAAMVGGGMYNDQGSDPTLYSCTFESNSANHSNGGGGMYNDHNSNPALENCTFNENEANGSGGGMSNSIGCNPTLINCVFTDNTAVTVGGGMWNYQSSPTLTGCEFDNNSAEVDGGGMFNDNSSPSLDGCIFDNNSVEYDGAGMCNVQNSSPILTNCAFTNNTAEDDGGGMFSHDSDPTLSNCLFTANTATGSNTGNGYGGGMFNDINSTPTITDCVFLNNYAERGGGMYNVSYNSNHPSLASCLFIANTAYTGGGMYNYTCDSVLDNCTFRSNVASSEGGGIYNNESYPVLTGCVLTLNVTTNGYGGGMFNDLNAYPVVASTTACSNSPNQIYGPYDDDNGNWIDDDCPTDDSDGDGTSDVMDNCYLYNPDQADCNGNGIGDACEIADQTSSDCDQNGVPDECQPDCDGDGHIDPCDIANHGETDWNNNGVPDNCEPDCNGNSIPDDWDIFIAASQDCNDNNIPDECDIADGVEVDCNDNGVPDVCDIADATEYDCDENGVLDLCELGELIETKLVPDDGEEGNVFGYSVSVSGDVAIVGSNDDDDNGPQSGSAYIYRFDGNEWNLETKLLPSDGSSNNYFGGSVSIDGNTAIVGANGHNDYLGAAYIYEFDGAEWNETKLVGFDSSPGDRFGCSVAIEGDVLIVGAIQDTVENIHEAGSAYIYRFSDGGWSLERKLTEGSLNENGGFGWSVGISGDTVIVGSPYNDEFGSDSGAAYIYRFDGKTWSEEQQLLRTDVADNDYFGKGVRISGDLAIVGAHGDNEADSDAGAAYIYRFDGTEWIQEAKLLAKDGDVNDQFGLSVSIEGATAIAGAHGNDDDGTASGSAYIFSFDGNQWIERTKLTASDPSEGAVFGYSVTIDGDFIMIGAYGDDDNGHNSGSAYIYGDFTDCNSNGIQDDCDIVYGKSTDVNNNGIPDDCELDCNGNAIPDYWDIKIANSEDCNGNVVPDECDITDGTSYDCNANGIPDECETDCNENGVYDECDISDGTSNDCNANSIPDECDIANGTSNDCNDNGVPDECDIQVGTSSDVNENQIPDECECLGDLDSDGLVDISDILRLIDYWGSPGPIGDINEDGVVGAADLLLILWYWGPCE